MLICIIVMCLVIIYSCYRFGIIYGLTLILFGGLFFLGFYTIKLELCIISFILLLVWWGMFTRSKEIRTQISSNTAKQQKDYAEYGEIEDIK